MDCLDENTVLGFVRGQVSPDGARKIGAHLDECVPCRLLVVSAAKSSIVAWSSSRFKASQHSQDGEPPGDPKDEPGDERRLNLPKSSGNIPDDAPTVPSLSNVATLEFVRSPEMLAVGQLIDGRFRLRRLLGRGAMGQIYAAYDERLRVQVALKMLLPNLAASKAYLERLHHEIVVARRISHPNVCRVYDLGKSGGLHFISMELVEGETLEVRLQREDLSERAVVHVLRQIVVGLDAAHRGGVIHRDLKPANIMINARGHVTVMDFGLARDMNNESTEREKGGGSVVGTPAYWSPEQARGDRATQASDIYSLGVIAYRMFTGSRPQLRTGQDPLLAVREPYRAVISRCLEPDPGKRFASADALLLAFAAAQRDASPVWTSYVIGAVGAGVLAAAFLGLRTWWPVLHGAPPTASSVPPPMAESALPSVAAAPVAAAAAIPVVPVESLPSSSVSTAAPSLSQHVSSANVAPRPPAHATTALPHGPSHRRADAPDAAAPVRIPVFD